jgi:hypothetical protein
MKKLLLLAILAGFLAGCQEESKPALVNITCYDNAGNITVRMPHYRGPVTIVDYAKDPGYHSQKCVIERAE